MIAIYLYDVWMFGCVSCDELGLELEVGVMCGMLWGGWIICIDRKSVV